MVTCLVIDDEMKSRESVRMLLQEYCPMVGRVETADSVKEGLEKVKLLKPDLLFLDVEMPNGDGFSMLQHFIRPEFKVIFITAYEQYAIRAIRFSALDYLLKPVDPDELKAAVQRFTEGRQKEDQHKQIELLIKNLSEKNSKLRTIALPINDTVRFINMEEIVRLEADSNYTRFHLQNKEKILVAHTLKIYEDLLGSDSFMRVHNSHIINLKKVVKYLKGKGGTAIMSDGSSIEISARRKEEFLNAFSFV